MKSEVKPERVVCLFTCVVSYIKLRSQITRRRLSSGGTRNQLFVRWTRVVRQSGVHGQRIAGKTEAMTDSEANL